MCNGKIVTDNKYGELIDILKYITPENNLWESVSAGASVHSFVFGNGWYVASSRESSQINIIYTKDFKTITKKSIANGYDIGISNLIFDGNNFVYIESNSGSNQYNLTLCYFNEPNGNIIRGIAQRPNEEYSTGSYFLRYINNKYVFSYSVNNLIGYRIGFMNSYNSTISSSKSYAFSRYYYYVNGYFITTLQGFNQPFDNRIYYSTDLINFSIGTTIGLNNDSNCSINYAWYDGEYHIIATQNSSYIYNFTNLTTSYTSKNNIVVPTYYESGEPILKKWGYLLIVSNTRLYYYDETNLSKYETAKNNKVEISALSVSYKNDEIIIGGQNVFYRCPMGKKVLPIIDGQESEVFIKGYS